jgi:hypothetical protein
MTSRAACVPVDTLDDFHRCCLAVVTIGEGVDVGSKACRGRGIDASDMVVNANLQPRVLAGVPRIKEDGRQSIHVCLGCESAA